MCRAFTADHSEAPAGCAAPPRKALRASMPEFEARLLKQDAAAEPAESEGAPQRAAPAPRGAGSDEKLAAGFALAVSKMASLAAEPAAGKTVFHSTCAPAMSLEAYAARLHQYFGCSGGCYVLALVYLDRIVKRCPNVSISPLSGHRLLLISLVVAAKFHDDAYYSNKYYSKVGGVRLQEMNRLETRFIDLLGWRLQVHPEEYETYQGLIDSLSMEAAPMPARRV